MGTTTCASSTPGWRPTPTVQATPRAEPWRARRRSTGVPFNDAYRYMDWLLTVPLLLIEILLVMKLDDDTFSSKAKTLGVTSALMIISGYYGELTVTGNLAPRWICWAISMCFFLNIVQELLVGLSEA